MELGGNGKTSMLGRIERASVSRDLVIFVYLSIVICILNNNKILFNMCL